MVSVPIKTMAIQERVNSVLETETEQKDWLE